ncbi:putative late blight resistance protein homolog R1B-19 [Quercus suber]|uniref:putative late blight resistance protein homolog R1B-19 n=1 Tax=Quercus suber TaxID=58331 RepID=UPI0032DE8642
MKAFVEGIYEKNGEGWQDLDEDELRSLLFDCLKDKRYLVVLDDIWEIEAWNEVSAAFPNNSNGSRILITSRIKEVALHATSVNSVLIPPYELPFLKEDKSWELFFAKAYHLLLWYWGVFWRIRRKHIEHGRNILAMSIRIYPEDFEIPVRQLIRLWIAEGFIQQIGNRNIEDIAEDYLEELIDWSLIQVATKRLDGGVKTCRIHDLLRDLCISESAEEKFLRISIHFANHPYISSSSNPRKSSNNRSVIGFQGVVGLESLLDEGYYLKWLCKSNKLVRVVELSNMAICCAIPKKIQNLFLLRYLSISSGLRPVIIPNSLCNLWNLETLDMRSSIIESLPKGLWKLLKLRHLYLNGPTSLPGTDNEEGLPNLQVLTGIALNHYTESLFAKARFPNLRKLGLCSSSVQESRLLILSLSSIHPMRHLQSLKDYKLRIKFIEPEN